MLASCATIEEVNLTASKKKQPCLIRVLNINHKSKLRLFCNTRPLLPQKNFIIYYLLFINIMNSLVYSLVVLLFG